METGVKERSQNLLIQVCSIEIMCEYVLYGDMHSETFVHADPRNEKQNNDKYTKKNQK